jgi:DNA-binding SARP family transcriptional activator
VIEVSVERLDGHLLALAREGNVAEALHVYADLRVLLRNELGVSPSATSQRVSDGLLHGEAI